MEAKASSSLMFGSAPSNGPDAPVTRVIVEFVKETEAPSNAGETVQLAGAKAPVKPTVGEGVGSDTLYWKLPQPSAILPLDVLPSITVTWNCDGLRQPKLPLSTISGVITALQAVPSVTFRLVMQPRFVTGRGACVTMMRKSS